MNRKSIYTSIRSPLLALALVVVFAGTALATASSNFHPAVLARGTLADSVQYNTGEVKFQTKAAVDFVVATVAIDVGGSSGWHEHPGVVLVTVASGTLTLYDAQCTATLYPAGSSFTESGDNPILVRNEGAIQANVHVTYIVPAGTPNIGLRIDEPNPGCPQF
jgi:quercetin dioxygenase-like cupin family protein